MSKICQLLTPLPLSYNINLLIYHKRSRVLLLYLMSRRDIIIAAVDLVEKCGV